MPATMPIEAEAMSASAKTMFGDLPPSSRVALMNRSPQTRPISAPVAVLPVNDIFCTRRSDTRGLPASAPKPVTTLTTPGGKPACSSSSTSSRSDAEVCSEGLITMVFPAASAGASLVEVSISGEFHGVIAPQTPSGSRWV